MNQWRTSSSGTVVIGNNSPVGSGGEGCVFGIESPGHLKTYCVKRYNTPDKGQRQQKIEFMLRNRPRNLRGNRYLVCWPEEMVLQNGRFVGFTMPRADYACIKLYTLCTNMSPTGWAKFDRDTKAGFEARLKLCVNIASAVHAIHSLDNYVLVDFKPQNVLVSRDGHIFIVDVDSVQISANGTVLFPGPVATPEYVPPEGQGGKAVGIVTKTWDRFSLAVVLYQVLLCIHPYSATPVGKFEQYATWQEKIEHELFVHGKNQRHLRVIPLPHKGFNRLPTSVQDLFRLAFDAPPDQRPSAETWGETIFKELDGQTKVAQMVPTPTPKPTIVKCQFGHIITYKDQVYCRECAFEGRMEPIYGRQRCPNCGREIAYRSSYCGKCTKATGWPAP